MPAVEVEDLTIRYDELVAVRDVSLTAELGTTTAILGPNGAGKTSLVECLEGYRPASDGRVRVLDLDPHREHDHLVGRIGVMLQEGGVQLGIRPLEVVELYAALYETAIDPLALLERVGLSDRLRTSWRRLSGGEKQRLSLALALTAEPEIAFLDEPTAGVDLNGRRMVHEVIDELRGAGCCVLLTTHDLVDAERLADRIIILDRGQIAADGSPADLTASSESEIRFHLTAQIDIAALAIDFGTTGEELGDGQYVLRMPPTPRNVARLASWLADRDLALGNLWAGRQSLEDVFVRLTSEETDARPTERRRRRGRP